MSTVAACLRVQVNNESVDLKSVLDFNPRLPFNVSMEQSCVFSLLRDYFIGGSQWMEFSLEEPMQVLPIGGIPDRILNIVGAFFENSVDSDGSLVNYVGDINGIDDINDIGGYEPPRLLGAVAFNDYYLKQGVKNGLRYFGWPDGWQGLVDMTAIEDLPAIMNEKLTFFGMGDAFIDIIKEPTTLTIHRCTQQDIDSLFQGDHAPHVDMFDTVKAMLTGAITEADQMDYSAATYDAGKDVIVFKSDYRLTQTTSFNNIQMQT